MSDHMTDSQLLALEISPSSGVPIYRQLMDQVRRMIASQHLSPGDPMPSVRHLAIQLAVNPMTISKAYSLMEAEGLLERQRGKGMIVSSAQPAQLSEKERMGLLQPSIDKVISDAKQLDLDLDQILNVIKQQFNA